jgi:DNA-binding Lrp family transcriptional regulator
MIDDREFIDLLAKGLQIESRPFREPAAQLGISEEEVIDRIKKLIAEGKVRRFAASVRHQPIGFKYNAMVIVRAEAGRIDEIGAAASTLDEVSHCYQRAHPDGDPNCVYIMVHGSEQAGVDRAVAKLQVLPGIRSLQVCASRGELKKTSVSGVTTDLGPD